MSTQRLSPMAPNRNGRTIPAYSPLPQSSGIRREASARLPGRLAAVAGIAALALMIAAGYTSARASSVAAVASISPSRTSSGLPPFTIALTGQNFASNSIVVWNGSTDLSTTFVSPTELKATVNAKFTTSAGIDTVEVKTKTILSNTLPFTVIAAPRLTSIAPATVHATAAKFTLTAQGSEFSSSDVITWNGTRLATQFVSSSSLVAAISASLVATPETVAVRVVDENNAESAPLGLSVVKAPALLSIAPSSAEAGTAGFTMNVTGANYSADSKVMWNGSALTTALSSATALTAQVPADLIAKAGVADVQVVQSDGSHSALRTFTTRFDPAISSVAPTNVPVGTKGVTLTVNGADFTSGSVVMFGSVPTATKFVSSTDFQCFIPASALTSAATVKVAVVDSLGISSNSASFAVSPLPRLASLSPSQVVAGSQSFTLSVTGANFQPGAAIDWNGQSLATDVVSATTATATISASLVESPSQAIVKVVNADGGRTGTLTFDSLVPPSNGSLWSKPLVWAHFMEHYPIDITSVAQANSIYGSLFPLDLSLTAPDNSPAIEIADAQAAGFDGFDVDVFTDASGIAQYLSAADSVPGFYIAPTIDPTALLSQGDTDAQITSAIVKTVSDYATIAETHVSAARDNNNLVIWTFGTNLIPLSDWQTARERLIADGITNTTWVSDLSFVWSGATFPQQNILSNLQIFEAGYVWTGQHSAYWPQLVDLFRSQGRNFAGGIMPGRDQNPQTYIDDIGTCHFRGEWQKNLDYPGEWAQVSTWNAYPSLDNIDPTSDWNTTRSDVNSWYASIFKGVAPPFGSPRLYVTSPQGINLNDSTDVAEALVLNPTGSAVTASLAVYDGLGNQIGSVATQTVAADSAQPLSIVLDFAQQPADGYCTAKATIADSVGDILASDVGAPCIVYPTGMEPSLLVKYYSIPALHQLSGAVGLTVTAGGFAAITPPAGADIATVDLLCNSEEVHNFLNIPPYTATVPVTSPGFYVARVIAADGSVGYSNPVFAGP